VQPGVEILNAFAVFLENAKPQLGDQAIMFLIDLLQFDPTRFSQAFVDSNFLNELIKFAWKLRD
jgi:hypothetical protein